MTFIFILGILAILVGLGIVLWGFRAEIVGAIIGGFLIALVVGGGLIFWSTFWANGVGEAKVQVNSVDRQIVGTIEEPGSGFKAPWNDFVDFDLFSQELVFAGTDGGAPSYTGGTVNGQEITVSVGGVSGGSTQARVDMTFVYSIDGDAVEDIYREYRSQERFTEQVVSRQVLSTARQVPSDYAAIEFRGSKRGEAEANQRTKEVENETLIATAQAEADANRILSESLTPEVIQIRRIEALIEAAKDGNLIIDGSDGSVLLPAK